MNRQWSAAEYLQGSIATSQAVLELLWARINASFEIGGPWSEVKTKRKEDVMS
jgi:hypothetical protein